MGALFSGLIGQGIISKLYQSISFLFYKQPLFGNNELHVLFQSKPLSYILRDLKSSQVVNFLGYSYFLHIAFSKNNLLHLYKCNLILSHLYNNVKMFCS